MKEKLVENLFEGIKGWNIIFLKYITLYLHLIFSTRLFKKNFPEEDLFCVWCKDYFTMVVIEG